MEGRPQDRCPLCSEVLQAAVPVRMTAEPAHMTAAVQDSGNRPGRPAFFREAEVCQPEFL